MIRFITEHKDHFGVKFICETLSEHTDGGFITSRGYRAARAREKSARAISDEQLMPVIKNIHEANYSVYGVRKMWRAMTRAGWRIGRDRLARLMRALGLRGVTRGRAPVTTHPAEVPDKRADHLRRDFTAAAPNRVWVADLTYVRTKHGFCYTAFVTDVFSRKIVGWAVSTSLKTDHLPLQALEHALYSLPAQHDPESKHRLIHHSDRGCQYVSLRYTEALEDAKVIPSVGSVGDSYDNALAETVNGLYKTELIYSKTTWASASAVELATMEWVLWWNTTRLHESLDYATPQEAETAYHENRDQVLVPA